MASTSSIVDFCRLRLRISADVYDEEIETLVEAVRKMMVERGVLADKAEDDTDELVRLTIAVGVGAFFGGDNPDSDKLDDRFDRFCTMLKGSQWYGKVYGGDAT